MLPKSEYLSDVWKDGIFDNRVVFVTGGAGTICSAQTRALVHLGANACIIGRSVEKTEAAAKDIASARRGAKVLGIGGVDVRKFEDLKNAADRCARELGGIDFVIAGAAGNFIAPVAGLSPNGFRTVIEIDTIGTYNTVKATIDHLVRSAAANPAPSASGRTGGRILYVSATFHYTGMPLQAHVSAAKAGVDSIMASVALEYGPLGVTSNVLAPGAIAGTEGMERLTSAASAEAAGRAVPTGSWGTKKNIADATVYLFAETGDYVNAHALVVDGGGWRMGGGIGPGRDEGMRYPDFLLKGEFSKQIKDGRRPKL